MNKPDEIAKRIMTLTNEAKTMGELDEILHHIAYTIGGMILHFGREERSQVLISLTKTIGTGFMNTCVAMGESSDIEIVVGKGG